MWSSTRPTPHSGLRGPRRSASRCQAAQSSTDLSVEDSLAVLELDSSAIDAAELRQAYYSRMRQLHPDVNPDLETTEAAAQVNAAYATLLEELNSPRSGGIVASGDVFDRCDGPLTTFFINPFTVATDPLRWREVRAAVLRQLLASQPGADGGPANTLDVDAATDLAVEEALLAVGLPAQGGVLTWLTAAQSAAVDEMMAEIEETLAFEVTAWLLGDCLLRAERTNRRAAR